MTYYNMRRSRRRPGLKPGKLQALLREASQQVSLEGRYEGPLSEWLEAAEAENGQRPDAIRDASAVDYMLAKIGALGLVTVPDQAWMIITSPEPQAPKAVRPSAPVQRSLFEVEG